MIKIKKTKKGFTLIELIIVIAIIGILAAIAVPKFGDIQRNSKIKADIASAKIISDAVSVLVTQGIIPEKTTVTALADAEVIDTAGTSSTTNPAVTDDDIALQIGFYLQSIPESSLYKNQHFKVIIASGNAIIYVDSNGSTSDGNIQVYPNPTDTTNPYHQ